MTSVSTTKMLTLCTVALPDEDRRELRGPRVFLAWLNHDASRAVNTLDSVVTRNGLRFVRHYLRIVGIERTGHVE